MGPKASLLYQSRWNKGSLRLSYPPPIRHSVAPMQLAEVFLTSQLRQMPFPLKASDSGLSPLGATSRKSNPYFLVTNDHRVPWWQRCFIEAIWSATLEYDEESLVVSFKQSEVKYLAIGSLTYFQKFLIFIAIEAIVISDIINHFGLYHLSVIFLKTKIWSFRGKSTEL